VLLSDDKCMGVIRFRTKLQARGPAAAIVLDDPQVATVGDGARRFPVKATVNGYTWRTSVARIGGEFLLTVTGKVCQGAGVAAGKQRRSAAGMVARCGPPPRRPRRWFQMSMLGMAWSLAEA
jgi:hypothetical protein